MYLIIFHVFYLISLNQVHHTVLKLVNYSEVWLCGLFYRYSTKISNHCCLKVLFSLGTQINITTFYEPFKIMRANQMLKSFHLIISQQTDQLQNNL